MSHSYDICTYILLKSFRRLRPRIRDSDFNQPYTPTHRALYFARLQMSQLAIDESIFDFFLRIDRFLDVLKIRLISMSIVFFSSTLHKFVAVFFSLAVELYYLKIKERLTSC